MCKLIGFALLILIAYAAYIVYRYFNEIKQFFKYVPIDKIG